MKDKRFLVTGASSGIGRATAHELARRGATVIAVGRDQASLQEVSEELPGANHQTEVFNLTDTRGIPGMMRSLADRTGRLDGVVHCAGIHQASPLRAIDTQSLAEIFELNVTSGFMLAKGARHKQVRGEELSIVFLASAVGLVGQVGVSAYSASKGAVIAATKSLALELAREKIRVNCVCPGVVRTPMTDALETTVGGAAFAEIEAAHPLGLGSASDVAKAITFLLGDDSRWITGTALTVDGGYTAS